MLFVSPNRKFGISRKQEAGSKTKTKRTPSRVPLYELGCNYSFAATTALLQLQHSGQKALLAHGADQVHGGQTGFVVFDFDLPQVVRGRFVDALNLLQGPYNLFHLIGNLYTPNSN